MHLGRSRAYRPPNYYRLCEVVSTLFILQRRLGLRPQDTGAGSARLIKSYAAFGFRSSASVIEAAMA